jgi:hypothetical protein
LSSETGGSILAAGSRPNRRASSTKAYNPSKKDAAGEHCYKRYNRKESVQAYRKLEKLVEALEDLFGQKPKLDEYRMREAMGNIIDPVNGGRMFCCFSKWGVQPPIGATKGSQMLRDWDGWCQSATRSLVLAMVGYIAFPRSDLGLYFGSNSEAKESRQEQQEKGQPR